MVFDYYKPEGIIQLRPAHGFGGRKTIHDAGKY